MDKKFHPNKPPDHRLNYGAWVFTVAFVSVTMKLILVIEKSIVQFLISWR